MTARARVCAVVLAGGRSSRFGGDKLAAELAGRTVLDHAIESAQAIADEVIVVGRPDDSPSVTGGGDAVHVPDDRAFEGPLSGLATGLRRASTDVVVVIGGDMPDLHPGVVDLLLARLDPASAVVLEETGEPRPLPVALLRAPARFAAEQALAAGERSLRAFVARLGAASVPEREWRAIDPQGDSLVDVDTRADLERLRVRPPHRG